MEILRFLNQNQIPKFKLKLQSQGKRQNFKLHPFHNTHTKYEV